MVKSNTFVNGIRYFFEAEFNDDADVVSVDVYCNGEHVVGVYFDHNIEQAVVEGPDFQESAPYFELKDMLSRYIAEWAIAQIP